MKNAIDLDNLMEYLEGMPTRRIVECYECTHSRPLNRKDTYENNFVEGCLWCQYWKDGVLADDYCSNGEKAQEHRSVTV